MPRYDYPGYSPTSHPFMEYRPKSKGKYHGGADTAAKEGTPVYAEHDGEVVRSGKIYGYGKAVVVESKAADGTPFYALYGHLGPDPLPQPGVRVRAGQRIPGAFVGSEDYVNQFPGAHIKGSHLHREIIHGKAPIERDPSKSFGIYSSNVYWRADPDTFDINNPVFPNMRGSVSLPGRSVPLPRPRPDIPETAPVPSGGKPGAPAIATDGNNGLARLLDPKPLTPNVSRLGAWPQPPYSAGGLFPQTPQDIINDRFYSGVNPSTANPDSRGPAPFPTPNLTAPAPLPPRSAPPAPLSSPASNAPHWLDAFAPRLDWLPPPPRSADSSDTSRPAAQSSAGDWLGLQQSDFGAFRKLPQGGMGKRSDLAPGSEDRFRPPGTNPLISMGLLRNPLDANQAAFATQAAPAVLSPQPVAPPISPSSEPEAMHWLDGLASLSPSPSVSAAQPWLDPETVGKGLRRLLGLPE